MSSFAEWDFPFVRIASMTSDHNAIKCERSARSVAHPLRNYLETRQMASQSLVGAAAGDLR